MTPAPIFVLLAFAAAKAEFNTQDDVVRFVKSNCVSIGVVAQETCSDCERACRPALELGEFCEDFCRDPTYAQCDILGKFRPGDAERFNDTANVYCGASESTDVCRALLSLRDAALLLESDNPCSAASTERDESSKDDDVCAKLLEDGKKLTLCEQPSGREPVRGGLLRILDTKKKEAPRTDDTTDTKKESPRAAVVDGEGLNRQRDLFGAVPSIQGVEMRRISMVKNCVASKGMCKGSCHRDSEMKTFHECEAGKICCFKRTAIKVQNIPFEQKVMGAGDLEDQNGNRPFESALFLPERYLFSSGNRVCDGTCSNSCGPEEINVDWKTCNGNGLKCCYPTISCLQNGGKCKADCDGSTEVRSSIYCESNKQCCMTRIL